MKLLVTGASGFLGRNFLAQAPPGYRITAVYNRDATFPLFVERLNKPEVASVQCDLSSRAAVAALFEHIGRDWDCCLHLAATVDIPWSVKEPQQDLLLNAGPLLNVLEFLQAAKFIYFSSGAVYDGLSGEVHPDAPLNPTLPYAISKLACERYVEFHRQRRANIERSLIVRFFGAYGPYEAPHKIYTRLLQAFALEQSDTYTIYGNGTNLIDAMYVDDAVEAVRRMIEGDRWNTVVNLAAGDPVTIESLVTRVAAALGVDPVHIRKQGIANESNQFRGSTAEMREYYDFQPVIPLEQGILRFRDFFLGQALAAKQSEPERSRLAGFTQGS